MALDAFGNYSRSLRQGAAVRRVYFGKGPVAQLAATLDDQRRAHRLVRARAAREAARAPAEASLRELDELVEGMMRATLLAAGYHRHDRGAWRRRRMNGDDATGGIGTASETLRVEGARQDPAGGAAREAGPLPIDPIDPGDRLITKGELTELLGRAEQGDRTVLPSLRRLLDAAPALWQHAGDVAHTAEADWVDLIAGRSLLVRESLIRKVAELKAELAGPGAPPLERLLAERVACCWMQAAQADSAITQLKGDGASVAQLDLMQRRQERAQRSYLAAIKALATVRKLVAVTPTSAPAPAPAVDAGQVVPRRGRKMRGRSGPDAVPANHPATDDRPARDDGPGAIGGKAAGRGEVVPQVLRDRLRGLVGSDN